MSGFAEQVAVSRSDLLYLARLKEAPSGKDAWYYVHVKSKAILPIFLRKLQNAEHIKLADFGEVLYYGWGAEPPEDMRQKVQNEFSSQA